MQFVLCLLIATAFSSAHGMASIDDLKKLDQSSLTPDQKIKISANDRARELFAEFERIKKLSSEKTLANAYKILGFNVTESTKRSAALEQNSSYVLSADPKIKWLAASKETEEFMEAVRNTIIAAYAEAKTILADQNLIQSTFNTALNSAKYTENVRIQLLEIYHTHTFFDKDSSIPDEVWIATRLLFPNTPNVEDILRKRTTQIVATISTGLKNTPIQDLKSWFNFWGQFFTNADQRKMGLLINNVSYPISPINGANTLVGFAAQQLISLLKNIKTDEQSLKSALQYLGIEQKKINAPWWASHGTKYFTAMFEGMLSMPLILKAGHGYFLALEWPKYFPGKTIEGVAELVKKALATALQSGLKDAIEIATFQNNLIAKMDTSIVGSHIVSLQTNVYTPDDRAKMLTDILKKPENISGLIYYRQRTTYPVITIGEIEKVITNTLTARDAIDPATLVALANRICQIDHLTHSAALSAPIVDQAREILFTTFAESLEALASAT